MGLIEAIDQLAAANSSVRGVIFCDEQGERVSQVLLDAQMEVYDLDVIGATYAQILWDLSKYDPQGQLRLVTDDHVTYLQLVRDGYYLVVMVGRDGLDGRIRSHLKKAARHISADM